MKLSYVGNRNRIYSNGKRYAEIEYSDKEEDRAKKICQELRNLGWNVDDSVENWGACQVEDRAEFDDFMDDWKKLKKQIK